MAVTPADIDAFQQFAKQELGKAAGKGHSLRQLLNEWEMKRESEATAEDIWQGLTDLEAGRGKSAAQAFADVRRKLGLSE